jgi:hypothetical protein
VTEKVLWNFIKKPLRSILPIPQVLQGVITTMFELGKDFAEIEQITETAVAEFPEKAEFWFFDGTAKLALKKGQRQKIH